MTERPFDCLGNKLGSKILVFLTDEETINGELVSFDKHQNLQLKNATYNDGEKDHQINNVFVRGDKVKLVS